ncbi:hypothetical protein VPG01_003 [Vibrio phage VPG01]|nr:hypothetical protein VPG01_003 [Vibrio phage VPG01]
MRPLHHVEIELKECNAKLKYCMDLVKKHLDKKPINKKELKRLRMAERDIDSLLDWHEKLTAEWLLIKG